MTTNGTNYVRFEKPIEFTIKIQKMYEVKTEYGEQLFIQGYEISAKIYLEFYCPRQLEYILRNLNIRIPYTVRIAYYGRNILDHIEQQQYFAEIISKT